MAKKKHYNNKKKEQFIPSVFLFLMLCVYPLYVENGFYSIGIVKNKFFLVVTISFVVCMLIKIGIDWLSDNYRFNKKEISSTDKWIFGFMAAVLVSFLFSGYKDMTLWGENGWYMGCIPFLIMGFSALFVAKFWNGKEWLLYGNMIVSGITFLLCICNRFSFYPIPMEPHLEYFVSTLGNINWFCGYLSVVAPLGVGLFLISEGKKRIWAGVYTFITFMTAFAQGSESVFLWFGAVLFATLFIAVGKKEWLANWFLLLTMWAIAPQFIKILIWLIPEKFNYSIFGLITSNVTLWVAIIAAFGYAMTAFVLWKKEYWKEKTVKRIRIGMLVLLGVGVILVIGIFIYHNKVGISALEGIALLTWNQDWGNGRGIILETTGNALKNMSPLQWIFGVGPDGYSSFVYALPDVSEGLSQYFDGQKLTNSHCEILNNVVNLGIVGTVAYVGLFVNFLIRCAKYGKKNPMIYVFAIAVIGYFANTLFSFAQVLNIPFLFITLGMGEYYIQKESNL